MVIMMYLQDRDPYRRFCMLSRSFLLAGGIHYSVERVLAHASAVSADSSETFVAPRGDTYLSQ